MGHCCSLGLQLDPNILFSSFHECFFLHPYTFLSASQNISKYPNYPWQFWVTLNRRCSVSKMYFRIGNPEDNFFFPKHIFLTSKMVNPKFINVLWKEYSKMVMDFPFMVHVRDYHFQNVICIHCRVSFWICHFYKYYGLLIS